MGWERVLESQEFESRAVDGLVLVLGGRPPKLGLEELDFSQAVRVASSTGHASAGASGSFAIVVLCEVGNGNEDINFG